MDDELYVGDDTLGLECAERGERQLLARFAEAERLAALSADERAVYCRLARVRRELARAARTAAYHVLTNRLLLELAVAQPRDEAGLWRISGLGMTRITTYGAALLAAIRGGR